VSLNRPVAQCPLLLQSDMIRLHRTLQIENIAIVDAVLGATHQALPTAVPLLQLLKRGTTYRELLLAAHRSGCSTAQLRELLGFLQISGGIERYRQLHTWPEAILYSIRAACIGIREPALAHRYKATPIRLLLSILSATRSVILLSAILALALSVASQWDTNLSAYTYAYALSLFIGSIYVHEAGHLIVLQRYRTPTVMIRQGLRIGLLHQKLDAQKELCISFVGPIAGSIACLAIAAICYGFDIRIFTGIALAIGCVHLCSLLPWYGDGKSVRAARREKRSASL